jgi:hypothetical protein
MVAPIRSASFLAMMKTETGSMARVPSRPAGLWQEP